MRSGILRAVRKVLPFQANWTTQTVGPSWSTSQQTETALRFAAGHYRIRDRPKRDDSHNARRFQGRFSPSYSALCFIKSTQPARISADCRMVELGLQRFSAPQTGIMQLVREDARQDQPVRWHSPQQRGEERSELVSRSHRGVKLHLLL